MSILTEKDFSAETLLSIAKKMSLAARTAPKTRGRDNIFTAVVRGEDLTLLSDRMKIIGDETGMAFFSRDAGCVLKATVVVLIGAGINPSDLDRCGYCGLVNCAEKGQMPDVPCAFNSIDLGIALGSAVSIAADHRIDNRIMFSIGKAAKALGMLPAEAEIIMGIPLSASGKNPFFDRG